MISFILSLVSGAATIANLILWQDASNKTLSSAIQFVAVVLAVVAIFTYRGQKTRNSYTEWGVKIFTLPMTLMFMVLLAAGGLLAAVLAGIQ